MKLYSNAGFSNPLHPVHKQAVEETAHGIRTGPANNDGHERINPLVHDAASFGTAVMIVAGWEWRDESIPTHAPGNLVQDRETRPDLAHVSNQCENIVQAWRDAGADDSGLTIEIGNELDLTDCWKGRKLRDFKDYVMTLYGRIRGLSPEVKIVTGSTSNFRKRPRFKWSRRGYEVLRCLSEMNFPDDTLQGLHPYKNDLPPRQWHDWGYEEGLDILRDLLGRRSLAVTEMGWHSGGDWNDDQIADFINAEIRAWREFGADSYVHYQLQDGPKPHNLGEGGFGAFTNLADGFARKPVASVLEKWKGLL